MLFKLFYIVSFIVYKAISDDEDTIILAHVIFRHGDRFPDKFLSGVNVFENYSYYPYDSGDLSLKGLQNSYKLGKILRQRYDTLLGNTYYPEALEALSSEYKRAKFTLQCVLASLYPSNGKVIPDLAWQPINFKYIKFEVDKLIMPQYKSCGVMYDLPNQAYMDENKDLIDYIANHTGVPITSPFSVMNLMDATKTHEENGHDILDWVKPIWPEPLKTKGFEYYKIQVDNRKYLNNCIGPLLNKIVQDTNIKIGNKTDTRMVLYSGHDINLLCLLKALYKNTFWIMNYTAYIALEVHNIGGIYGVKMRLENFQFDKAELLPIQDCGFFCPLDKFIVIAKAYLPKKWCDL